MSELAAIEAPLNGDADVEAAIAACGDVHAALRATLAINAFLEAELRRTLEMVSAGYGRGRVRQVPCKRPAKESDAPQG